MRIAVAIVIAGALIAAAILFAFRWEISAATGVVYRLDKWTGRTVVCPLSAIERGNCDDLPFDR